MSDISCVTLPVNPKIYGTGMNGYSIYRMPDKECIASGIAMMDEILRIVKQHEEWEAKRSDAMWENIARLTL